VVVTVCSCDLNSSSVSLLYQFHVPSGAWSVRNQVVRSITSSIWTVQLCAECQRDVCDFQSSGGFDYIRSTQATVPTVWSCRYA
jgi:hypothetical protein